MFYENLEDKAREVKKKPQNMAQATGILGEKRRRTSKINRFIRSQSDLLNGIRQQRAHTQLGKSDIMFQHFTHSLLNKSVEIRLLRFLILLDI